MLHDVGQRLLHDTVSRDRGVAIQAGEIALGAQREVAGRVAAADLPHHFFQRSLQAEHVQHFRTQAAHQRPATVVQAQRQLRDRLCLVANLRHRVGRRQSAREAGDLLRLQPYRDERRVQFVVDLQCNCLAFVFDCRGHALQQATLLRISRAHRLHGRLQRCGKAAGHLPRQPCAGKQTRQRHRQFKLEA